MTRKEEQRQNTTPWKQGCPLPFSKPNLLQDFSVGTSMLPLLHQLELGFLLRVLVSTPLQDVSLIPQAPKKEGLQRRCHHVTWMTWSLLLTSW